MSALALLLSAVPSRAGEELALPGGSARIGSLPTIPVRITNEADSTLSLSVPSAACTPRVLLEPRASIVVDDCLRWGLVHQVVAIFYDEQVVHERQFRLLIVAPGQDWVFSRRLGSDAAAAAKSRP